MAQVDGTQLKKLFQDVERAIAFDQPKLVAEKFADRVRVTGSFIVRPTTDEFVDQGIIAEYVVQIDFPADYPDREPRVIDTGVSIPRNIDHHMYDDGRCCIIVWDAWSETAADTSVQAFIDGPLKNFFLGQFLKKTTGEWPFGEEQHGTPGIVDAFAERLGCTRNKRKILYLLRILARDWPRGHWRCPCDSGKRIRHCCREELSKLHERIRTVRARKMLELFRVIIKHA